MFKRLYFLGVCLCLSSVNACAQNLDCETDNAALQAMPPVTVEFTRDNGSLVSFNAKLADNNSTRAAGFQRVCDVTIRATPILFTFEYELTPNFHMNNVVAPLDVAFIDKNGGIESIQLMKTYSLGAVRKPLYSPKRPIVAVFEAHKGFFEEHNLNLSSKVDWRVVSAQTTDEPIKKIESP